MRYYLPNVYGDIRSDKNGFTQLAKLKETLNSSSDDEFIVDFSKCGFFEANMSAPLKAVLSSIADKPKLVTIERLSQKIESILRKNLFLTEYGYSSICDSYATALPYRCFQTSDRKTFDDYLDIHLSGKNIPKMSQELKRKFRQSIFEIFDNCAIHSGSDKGVFVCGQFYPKLNRLDLTISDAGIGIRTNVRRVFNPKISSVDAIRWAIQEGNTTKTGSQPGGFGLALLQSFIKQNQGKIQIISRQGYYEFVGGVPKFEKLDLDFLGTTINLEIKTDDNKSYCLRSEVHSKENIF
ncbi:MAG: ATP-binding protein [Methylococcales bacterium]|nr:ATP-binding protein [Methylococcales bacterium]